MTDQNLRIPRTLIVDISASFGGANARVLSLMKNLPKEAVGLATIEGSVIAPELERSGYRVHRLASRKFDLRIPFRMAHIIRTYGYQVVDTQNPQSKLWGSLGAFLGGAALISTLNSWYMNEHPKYSVRWFVYTSIEFITNFALARYIVVSQEIQNAMLHAGIPAHMIDLIYNAVKVDASPTQGDREVLLKKYHLPSNSIICLAAGRLAWAKAHDNLLAAVAQARDKNPNLYCLIAGEGELSDSLKRQAALLGLENFVILPGHIEHNELLSTLKACDIYVMPSRTEGTPIALLEAAALEKPIIASNVGGIPELVVNEEHALLVEAGDVTALSRALLRVAGDAELALRLGQNAKARINGLFSLEKLARSTADSYIKAYRNKKRLAT